jgi:hypothetical protein
MSDSTCPVKNGYISLIAKSKSNPDNYYTKISDARYINFDVSNPIPERSNQSDIPKDYIITCLSINSAYPDQFVKNLKKNYTGKCNISITDKNNKIMTSNDRNDINIPPLSDIKSISASCVSIGPHQPNNYSIPSSICSVFILIGTGAYFYINQKTPDSSIKGGLFEIGE